MQLTEEDFRDLREVQPFLLTREQAFLYETRFRGEETDGRPTTAGWFKSGPGRSCKASACSTACCGWTKQDFSIIRSEGEAVPQIRTMHTENLFPRFVTVREKVDGNFWFPATTSGDDTLQFKSGPQRMRMVIRYSHYRNSAPDSQITYGK